MSKCLILFVCVVASNLSLNSQCPTAANAMCDMLAGQYDNVVLGEISGDSGQSDGCNDAIVEIIGPPNTDIGCMVVSDSEWAVLIPSGSIIPADGVFLIACSSDMSSSCGVGLNGGSNGLIAGADPSGVEGGGLEGDFNMDLIIEIDLDVCDPANASLYDPAASGFTLDNSGAMDGEQVMLFLPDGTPHDGIFWGGNGGSGGADHCSVQTGNPYTLGDNDTNGVVNDNAGTVLGGRCDGSNATAVPILPTDMACGCNTPGSPGTFTMPPLTDPVWFNMTPTSATFVGCNSSWVRGGPTSGSHGNPSHMDGEVTSTTQVGGQNTTNGGGASGTTGDTFTPTAYTPSACGDPSAEWNYTDHPSPGQPNNDATFVFYASAVSACAVTEEIIFTVEIYNYQNVSDGSIDGMSGIDDIQAGSFVEVNGTQMTYDSYSVSGETTTMMFSFSSWNVGTNTVAMVWDDYSNCCGTTGNPATQSSPNECYETETFIVEVAEELVAVDTDIQCPDDNPQGAINLADYVTGGLNLIYTLENNAAVQVGPQSSGGFILTTGDGPWTATISDGSGCHPDVMIVISDNCEEEPICPEDFDVDIDGGTDPIEACPGQDVVLCFNGNQLPPGGSVTWQYSDDGGTSFNTIESFPIPAPMAPTEAYISQFIYDPGTVPVGCSDGNAWGNGDSPEVVEIVATPNADVSCWVLSDGEGAVVFPMGTIVPSDGVLVLCGSACVVSSVPGGCDVTFNASNTSGNVVFANGGDQIILMDDAGNIIDFIGYGSACGDDTVPATTGVNGCTMNPGAVTTTGGALICASDLTNTGQVINSGGTDFGNNGSDYGGFGVADGLGVTSTTLGGYDSTPADMEFCSTFTIPNDSCPISDYSFQAVVDPFDSDNCPVTGETPPDEIDAISNALSVTVACPDAIIDATPIDICEADASSAFIPVSISGGTGPYILIFSTDNGVTSSTLNGFMDGDNIEIIGPTMGEIKVVLVSITDEGGALCSGTVNDAEVCLNIRPTEELTVTGSSNPTSCDPCDGSVTFDLSDPLSTSSNNFEISYSFNGSLFLLAGVSLPFTIDNACPGVYDIVSAEDDAGCMMNVVSSIQNLDQPTGSPVSVSGGPGIVCNDGTASVDLTSDFDYTPVFNMTEFVFYTADPNTLPPAALPAAEVANTTIMPTADKTFWVQFTDANGCISVATLSIEVDPNVCVMFTCPTIGDLTVTGNVCDNNEFTLTAISLDDDLMNQMSGAGPFQIQYVYYVGAGSAPANPYTTTGMLLGAAVSSGGMATLTSTNAGLPAGDLTIVALLTPTPSDVTCIPFAIVEVENLICNANAGGW